MKICNSEVKDIDTILQLYKLATDYQRIKFPSNQWPIFKRDLVALEIQESRQWKLTINGQIGCVWSTTFTDPQIWEQKNRDPAIYIHRIATNPEFRGQHFVTEIVKWAIQFAKQHNKKYIRMDTCGKNDQLIAYYKKCGFHFLGIHKLKDPDGLPAHYIGADVCFFEIIL